MKALIKEKPQPGIWLGDQPLPAVGPDDVLIKIRKTAICGTDVHIFNWDAWAAKTVPTPLTIGHEYCGEIAELGGNVRHLALGQRVTGEGHIVGGKSRMARAGRYHLDPDTRGVGVNLPGAFAEYLVIPAFNVVPLPDHLSDDIGAILDPLGNAVHTALAFDLVGEDVLITGAGPIGIMAAAVARHIGARHVVLTDVNDYRLALAEQITDLRTVNVAKEDLRDVMAELKMNEGFDIGFEMSGVPSAFDQMVDAMIMGGRIALLGIPAEARPFDWSRIIFKALTLKAIYGREMFETWYKMIAMLESGLAVEPIVTHRFAVDDYEQAFAVMRSGESGKVVLDWAAA
ncbi:L-threonine 3-dehydrogenase [Pelagibius litoralis]|uniref:L-threonine 3-dehydrogenase n=1 Tax=Pelagibius litoralis TaxID=374515 RepID=A0A967EWM4_9PROT|nr:L-threonine 3-dehydrogenase [Pelagibius litoralis]NIA67428.1 L-threonine 3-dehydrogenase [Pelagibius litoralis]